MVPTRIHLPRPHQAAWRTLQTAVWAIGLAILAALLWQPTLGIHAFWNVLIPVAPALLVVAPGLWRNICPLGSTALVPRHLGMSARRKLSPAGQARLRLLGVVLLLSIVPLRHVVMDSSGPATAGAIIGLALLAVAMGTRFEWKSGWCSGLCPVHPVVKLYGQEPGLSPPNAHCDNCFRCVEICPDSTPAMHPMLGAARRPEASGTLMVGGFSGFIWGWFQVRDYAGGEGWSHLDVAYAFPLAGLLASLGLFLWLRRTLPARHRTILVRSFAAAAVAIYYWYRLPALFGFGPFPGDGMLVDLRQVLGAGFPWLSRLATTVFFFWWLVLRTRHRREWATRPPLAHPA